MYLYASSTNNKDKNSKISAQLIREIRRKSWGGSGWLEFFWQSKQTLSNRQTSQHHLRYRLRQNTQKLATSLLDDKNNLWGLRNVLNAFLRLFSPTSLQRREMKLLFSVCFFYSEKNFPSESCLHSLSLLRLTSKNRRLDSSRLYTGVRTKCLYRLPSRLRELLSKWESLKGFKLIILFFNDFHRRERRKKCAPFSFLRKRNEFSDSEWVVSC